MFSLAQRRAIEAEAHVAEAEPLLPDEFGEQLRPIVMQFRGRAILAQANGTGGSRPRHSRHSAIQVGRV